MYTLILIFKFILYIDDTFQLYCVYQNIVKIYLAVLSPEPLAKRSVLGFQAHIKTSDSCPLRTVALLAGISID